MRGLNFIANRKFTSCYNIKITHGLAAGVQNPDFNSHGSIKILILSHNSTTILTLIVLRFQGGFIRTSPSYGGAHC